jgi:prevent-host-death family protein
METVLNRGSSWQLQQAKAQLSEVVKCAKRDPQIITLRGEETAVVLSIEQYRKLVQPKPNFFEFMQNSPLANVELNLKRNKSTEKRSLEL